MFCSLWKIKIHQISMKFVSEHIVFRRQICFVVQSRFVSGSTKSKHDPYKHKLWNPTKKPPNFKGI